MSLRNYDLNLLPILDALLRHRNLTRAGRELGLTQPAMSHALQRIRQLFNDQLLVQRKKQMLPSSRADEVASALRDILQSVDTLLDPKSFDPKSSRRRFRIATADYVAFLFLPNLVRRLEKEAPKASVQVFWDQVTVDPMQRTARLRAKDLDIAIVPRGHYDATDLVSERLIVDELVVITARNGKRGGKSLSRRAFEQMRGAVVRMEDPRLKTFAEAQRAQHHASSDDGVMVSNPLLLPSVVEGTGYAAVISRRVAEKLSKTARIQIHDLPFPSAKLHLHAYWAKTVDSDPGHSWFRRILREECQKL